MDDTIVACKNWVENIVVGLNFCPFAKKEVLRDSIRYCLSEQTSRDKVIALLDAELKLLQNTPDIETTLLILPNGFESFFDYLDLLDAAEDWLDQNHYRGEFQLASFHPDYCFEDEPLDAPSNFTNRSPYPILHILRESSLERALDLHKQPEQIPTDNIKKAQQIGYVALSKLLQNCFPK